ncbi:MAG: competence type IV pilus major pilin ComGC [Bacillota bacterium]
MMLVPTRVRRSVRRILSDGRGFTLVEMLIVLAIIGVLAAIAVPNLMGMTTAAKRRACDANCKTLEAAVGMYYAETDAWPTAEDGGPLPEEGTNVDIVQGELVTKGYLTEPVECPVDQAAKYQLDADGRVSCTHAE